MFHYFPSRQRSPLCSYLLSLYAYVHIIITPRIVAIFAVDMSVLTYDIVGVLIRQTTFYYLGSGLLKMGPINYPETSVRNYYYTLSKSSEESRSHLLHGGSLKSFVWEVAVCMRQLLWRCCLVDSLHRKSGDEESFGWDSRKPGCTFFLL